MREIDKVRDVVERLKPHMPRIEENFNRENEKFKAFLAKDHDAIGRILKAHLILEQYVNRYLVDKFKVSDLCDVRLTFFQKAKLLPDTDPRAAFLKPAILELNSIRNRFGHSLEAEVTRENTREIDSVLDIARRGAEFPDVISRIEAFTTIACTFLMVNPKDIDDLFARVFREVYQDGGSSLTTA